MNAPMSDDEFVSHLRESAFDAAGTSTLDVDAVLRSSRRKHTARRAGYAVAAGLALSTAGMGAAGAIPGIPGLWDSGPVQVEPSASTSAGDGTVDVAPAPSPEAPGASPTGIPAATEAEPQVTEVGPGVQQVTRPITKRVDADTVVIDLGLGAWADGRRFLARIDLGVKNGRTVWTDLKIFAGDGKDFGALAAGRQGGTVLWQGVTNDAMVLRADGGATLVFGLTSPAQGGLQHLVLDEPLVAGDPSTASVEIKPFDVLGDGKVWLRVAEVRSEVAPRGFVYSAGERWGASWCRPSSAKCAVVYQPATDTVVRPDAAGLPGLIKELGTTMATATDRPAVTAMERCVAQRTGRAWTAPADLTEAALGTVPSGVAAERWRLCLLDLSEAAVALQQGLIDVSAPTPESPADGGGDILTPAPDEPQPSRSAGPIETVTDGVGEILDQVLGGGDDGDAGSGDGSGKEDSAGDDALDRDALGDTDPFGGDSGG
ncbi:hypothetical protein [Myceligenerans crystallogenes]|uniref:Uncharacterized protein n=1 Tax=Myceligenerans crystallogenes TaxID=316335 RepID=A0ABN2NGJ4_9MICO